MSARNALHSLRSRQALREVDIAFADLLARLGASDEVALAGALAMRAVALGHSGFALDRVDGLLDELEVEAALPDAATWARALADSALVGKRAGETAPLTFEHGRVSLRRYARYEADLALRLARRARERRLSIVTGGPGTGKTTRVAQLLARFVADGVAPERIALAAPTGRAAARMGEAIGAALRRDVEAGRIGAALAASIPRDAKTLHRLLGWQKGKAAFRHDARNPLPHEVVVVDEASMIDLPLMAKLVAAVRDAATLVLLGDPDQLPAVEAGDVLGALCDAPALAAARVHLRHGWRQSEAPRLSALAKTVGEGDGEAALAALRAGGDGLQWREGGVAQLEAALAEFALPDYRAMLAAPDPHAALELAARSRVLTALRHGPFGAAAWNAWFARRLGGGASAWFHGRLVMVVANDYRLELFNGDTGIAWEDGRGEIAVWFGRRGAPLRPAQLPAHDSAYATTVHKAQGSEFDRVALVLPDADSRVLNRELVYTALTRARSGVLVWGAEAQLRTAIRTSSRRESGLAEQLKALRD